MTEFLTENTSLPPYMVFPRFLLDMELNETTKLLYMVLLDRARLSLKNEGWTDTSGHVFLYFTIEAMAEVLHKSQMTIKTSLAALEKEHLILRKRQGAGHPNRIYVKFPAGAFCQTDRILSLRQIENCPVIRKREIRTIYQKERVRRNALPMENFKMYFCQKRTGRSQTVGFRLAGIYRTAIRLHGFHRKALPEPCSHHHQLGKAGQSPFPAKHIRK